MAAITQAAGRAPSLVAAILRDGRLAHLATAGLTPVPHADLQYRIGSITKTMTAALVLGLRDQGALELDDPLERHLPGTGLGARTLRQLLGHASGAQREPDGDWWERHPGPGVADLVAGAGPAKVAYPAHRGYHYSNLGYGLLGAVVERLAGAPWFDAVRERLLEPLGMRRTTYQATEPYARGYVVHPWHDTLREEPREDAGAMAPAGQLWSTPADLLRWADFLISPDAAVLAPASVAELGNPVVISDPDSWLSGHGLGLQLWRRRERVFRGHTGSMPGYLAVLAAHRPSGTAVVAFANAYSLRGASILGVGLDTLEAVLDGEPARTPQPWLPPEHGPDPAIRPLTGRWWWMGREYQVTAGLDAADLVLTALATPGAPPSRFRSEGGDRWRGYAGDQDGEPLRVLRDAQGRAVALDLATFVLTRDPDVLGP
ncbi:MAG TPA: serine hydrolase domain-containing protein [Rugosimonospora sp.]|nr:serine hydrolase domain-containing protein [Rugosimonospora sp.]